jgi:hypothetical protein
MKLKELKIDDIIIVDVLNKYYIIADIFPLSEKYTIKAMDLSPQKKLTEYTYFQKGLLDLITKVDLPISDYA